MKREYRIAFSEVNEILKLMPIELVNKIPIEFRNIIEEERAKDYFPNIQEPIEDARLSNETIILLGLIYRDFLCSAEEKKQLYEKEKQELETMKKEIEETKEKINYNDMLKNISMQKSMQVVTEEEPINQEKQLVTIQEEKWYQKIFNLIKELFNRKE